MLFLIALANLIGLGNAVGGGGCPLNHDDSCGWRESYNAQFCYKTMYHGKSYMDAAELCWSMGTPDCSSKLITIDQIDEILAGSQKKYLPEFSRLDAFSYGLNHTWEDSKGDLVEFPEDLSESMDEPFDLPHQHLDHHVISAVWDLQRQRISGHTPVQDRVSYICTSCTAAMFTCPVICEFCIPHAPVDGRFASWTVWSSCSGTCKYGMRQRSRECIPPRYGGDDCYGPVMEQRQCEVEGNEAIDCDVNGGWGSWLGWSDCIFDPADTDITCGPGIRSRERFCNNPVRIGSGLNCSGLSTDLDTNCTLGLPPCGVGDLPGGWCSWTVWSPCSQTCGFAETTRTRECLCPPPGPEGGADCFGPGESFEYCRLEYCEPVDGSWATWTAWSDELCSLTAVNCPARLNDYTGMVGQDFQYRLCEGHEYGGGCPGDIEYNYMVESCMHQCTTGLEVLFVGGYGDIGEFDLNFVIDGYLNDCRADVIPDYPEHLMFAMGTTSAGKPVVCGGLLEDDTVMDMCYMFEGGAWVNHFNLTEPRFAGTVVKLNEFDTLFIGGSPSEEEYAATTEILRNPNSEYSVSRGPNMIDTKVYYKGCSVALTENIVFVLGGEVDYYDSDRVLKLTISTGQWEYMPSMNVRRANHGCGFYKNDMNEYEIVAALGSLTLSVEVFNFNTQQWTLKSALGVSYNPSGSTFDYINRKLYFFGGEQLGDFIEARGANYDVISDVWEYDISELYTGVNFALIPWSCP